MKTKIDNTKIDRLRDIKQEMQALKEEADRLEGEIIAETREELENTKYKTLTQCTENGSSVTVTLAEKVTTVYPAMLKAILGAAYEDMVKVETTYTLNAAAKKLLASIWTGKYIKMSLPDAISQLPLSEDKIKQLGKKLKGVKFETDKKNLMNIGGLDEKDAEEYAYLLMEAANWQQFDNLMKLNGRKSKDAVDEIYNLIITSIMVDETPKISIKSIE